MIGESYRKDAQDLAYTLERFGFEDFAEQYAKECVDLKKQAADRYCDWCNKDRGNPECCRTDRCEKRSAILGNGL